VINWGRTSHQRRSKGSAGGAGRTRRQALTRGGKRAKIVFKIHMKIQIVISYMFACDKNKALHQLQRVPILCILGYNIRSLSVSGL